MKDRILLIRTGGTIDAEPYANPRRPPKFVKTLKGKDSLIMSTAETLSAHPGNMDGLSWGKWNENRFVKDSQKFTPLDIKELAKIIRQDDHQYIVITHGTDAMVKNASALQQALQGSHKTVVFVGAMVPLSMHPRHISDGVDALRFALAHITDQPAGVQVLGHDSQTKRLVFFDPADVTKDRAQSKKSLEFTLSHHSR